MGDLVVGGIVVGDKGMAMPSGQVNNGRAMMGTKTDSEGACCAVATMQ